MSGKTSPERLSSGEILVADTNAVEIYAGNSYELEFIRNGAYDAYDVYFRKAAQVKAGDGKRIHRGTAAGNADDTDSVLNRGLDELVSGIGDTGRACIRYKSDV